MSTFPLDQIDEHLLKQIVRKGTRRTYRSRYDTFPNIPLEFSRIEKYICESDYIKTVLLPEVAAVGRVGKLYIGRISEGDDQLLIAAAKPETVALLDKYLDPTSPIFENIKNLCIYAVKEWGESYWRTKKLFELAKNRRSITLRLWYSSKEIIGRFIENWLKGEQTGTLERLSFIQRPSRWTKEDMMMKGFTKTCEGGYILERGIDRRRITANFTDYSTRVHFYFS